MCINVTARDSLSTWKHVFREQQTGRYISATISFLSAIGSLSIIVSYCSIPALRKATSRQILLFLAVADFFASLSTGIGSAVYLGSFTVCEVQAFVTVVSTLSSVLWSTCMAIYMYLCIGKEDMQKAKKLQIPFHIISWGVPISVAVAALVEGALGSPGLWATIGWCWIDEQPDNPSDWRCDKAQMLWMLLSLKGWEVVSYIIIPAMYISAKMKIRKTLGPARLSNVSDRLYLAMVAIDHKLSVLPLAYVMLRVWGTVRVFLDFSDAFEDSQVPSGVYKTFFYLQAVGDNAQGIVNFVLFVWLTDVIRNKLPSYMNFSDRWQKWRIERQSRKYNVHGDPLATTSNSTALLTTSASFAQGAQQPDPLKESLLGGEAAGSHWWSAVDYSDHSLVLTAST